ncbi:uncharacterized protein LOC124551067 [Schistocerca americana]|uniref:uncharacterized protein LOC124551067 n=1 Tax=Schistocerca americana TaxID=7009 RepID=UPI001F4FEDD8|nr:uncharacterized protein LOC124551067 [Schistocerca americana]
MSALREIVTAVTSALDGSAAVKYNKGAHNTGEGDRYEERVLALVFLRCLRRGLIFQLSANNGDAGKFDDVVLVWRPKGHPEARIMFIQLKHKKSAFIHSTALLSGAQNCDFGLSKYCTSYREISESLEMGRLTFVLLTNASLGDSSLSLLERQDVDSTPELELLQAGGNIYRLNPNNEQVWKAVGENTGFVEHFYLLCQQRNSVQILSDIDKELEELLGAGDLCRSISDSLCESIRKWMNKRKGECLTSAWSDWQALVDKYVRTQVTGCKALTTSLEYRSVADVRDHVESCNPAWVRPLERGTAALSATKIHQALVHETHIMVDLERFPDLRHQILCCWGPFCRWLVLVDSEKDSDILSELAAQIENERRLIIVSSRENKGFDDTFQTCDVSDNSWNKLLDVEVRLNGDCYECRLGDQVADVDALKSLLDGKPRLLLALAQLSPPLRMGRELETLPAYYVPRKLVDRRLVTNKFFSSLGRWDVCVIDSASYGALSCKIGIHSVTSFAQMKSWFRTQFKFDWPLIVLTEELESIREAARTWPVLKIYVLQFSNKKWNIVYYFGHPDRIGEHRVKQKVEQYKALDTASNTVIVEGRPGVGKSKVLSHVAEQIKGRDPACWILRINLLEFYTVLDDSDSSVEDILRAAVFNKDELARLECALLRHSLLRSPRVVCLVDGFDEVCPDYVDKCIEVLALVAPRKGKLLVTTRPAALKVLAARMGVLAHSLEPFSDSELKEFFTLHPLRGNIPPIAGLNKSLRDLLRIPLFAEMFVNLSQEVAETWDIVTLYETFFRNNFRRLYEEKLCQNISVPGKKAEVVEKQEQHEAQLMALAESVLSHTAAVPTKLPFDTDYFVKSGIVYQFTNGKPAFLHRTFAEHFLAKLCFVTDRKQFRARVYRKAYVNKRLEFFLESFDRRAARGLPLLEALLDGDERKMAALLGEGGDVGQADACGRNVVHLAAAHRLRCPLPLLRRLCRRAAVGALSAEDRLLGWTPMRYAAEGGRWAAVKALLEAGGDVTQLGDFRLRLHDPAELLGAFERGGYWALYEHIFSLNNTSWRAKAAWKGVGTQMQFALSVISAKMPRHSLRVIAEKAREEEHHTVRSMLLHGKIRTTLSQKGKKVKPKYVHPQWSRIRPPAHGLMWGESHIPSCATEILFGVTALRVEGNMVLQEVRSSTAASCSSQTQPQHTYLKYSNESDISYSSQTQPWHLKYSDESGIYSSLYHSAETGDANNQRALTNLERDTVESPSQLDSSLAAHESRFGCAGKTWQWPGMEDRQHGQRAEFDWQDGDGDKPLVSAVQREGANVTGNGFLHVLEIFIFILISVLIMNTFN